MSTVEEMKMSVFTYLEENHVPDERYVAAVIRDANGKEFKAMHMRHFANKICSELAALVVLVNSGDEITEPLTVAAATYVNGEPRIVNSCGRCRQVLGDHFAEIRFVMNKDGELQEVSLADALPFAYLKNGATT